MNFYASVKTLHMASVALSLAGFLLRAAWMAYAPHLLALRPVRIVPHVVDTILLLSGVTLAWQLGWAGVGGWLPAKIAGLVVYIVLGAIALRRGRSRGVRVAAAIGAVVTFAWIVSVAITKNPLGFFTAI
jgi:uncharacterized membrane protein SirB2